MESWVNSAASTRLPRTAAIPLMAVLFITAPAHAAPEQVIFRDVPAPTRAALVRDWGSDDCRPMATDVLQTTDLNEDGRMDYWWSSDAIECSGAGFAPSTIWISGLDGGFRKFDTYGWQFITGPMGSAVLTNACGDDTLSAFEARQNASVLGWDNRTDDFVDVSGCRPTQDTLEWAVMQGFLHAADRTAMSAGSDQSSSERAEPTTEVAEVPPRWLRRVAPEFPERAVTRGVTRGSARISCTVATNGALEDCRIDQETPEGFGFGASALQAARRSRASPATIGGVPRVYRLTFETRFGF